MPPIRRMRVMHPTDPWFIGSWEADRSEIPNYVPHREWLHFREDGTHTIESLHPGQDALSAKIDFVLEETEAPGAFHLRPTKLRPNGSAQEGWRISIVRSGVDELAVTPDITGHGHTSIYRRIASVPRLAR